MTVLTLSVSNTNAASLAAKNTNAKNGELSHGDPLRSEWRAVSAPPDFAARVVALALATPAELDVRPTERLDAARGSLRLRGWSRRIGFGVAMALGVSAAAAALSVSRNATEELEHKPLVVQMQVTPATHVVRDTFFDTARSERSVGSAKRSLPVAVVPSVEEPAPASGEPEVPLLPAHLHVPPCQCTLSAVVCSCVE